ncbi:MAG: barstar family protein [Lachnospiraceae bacterium]
MQRRVTLSGNKMTSKEALHTYLAKKLGFPAYYGKNLDALHDCLCEIAQPLCLTVTYTERLLANTGDYGTRFLSVLKTAASENTLLTLAFFPGRRM